LKNKNVNKTMKKLSSIQKLIKVYDENVYQPPANNNIGIDNNIKNMEHINSDDVKDVKKISSVDTISSVDDIFEYLCLHGIQINLNKSNNKLSFTRVCES
jgi:hypothetical protein